MLAGPGDNLVRILVVRLSPLALIARPIEPERAVVKQRLEPLAVLFLQLGLAAVAEHEEVAAEPKVVAELLDLDLCAPHRLATRIPYRDDSIALAVLFDASAGLSEDVLVGRFGFLFLGAPGGKAEQQGGGAGPGFEECSSIHQDSKQQRRALLKSKTPAAQEHPPSLS